MFNHAMIYTRDVAESLKFYQGLLGLELLEEFRHESRPVYARLRSPDSDTTIALHLLGRGEELHTGGIRLYFEAADLDGFCARLEAAGAKFTQPPKTMPWGWKHAYLNDPDGHEVSVYHAGALRLARSPGIGPAAGSS
jgi:catechol 2,3-dioxygenase-like lactoylglutathione lyase family enzyme